MGASKEQRLKHKLMVVISLKKSIRKYIYPKLNRSIETQINFFNCTTATKRFESRMVCNYPTQTPTTKGVFGFQLEHPNQLFVFIEHCTNMFHFFFSNRVKIKIHLSTPIEFTLT